MTYLCYLNLIFKIKTMKSFFSTFSLFIFVLLIACNNPAKTGEESISEPKITVSPNDQDTISQATFTQWTALWDSLGSNYSDTSLVKYYHFPMIDMVEFLGTNARKAFFYQGLEPLVSGGYEAHLILTGIDSKGNNIGKYYDVTRPCPKFCGPFN